MQKYSLVGAKPAEVFRSYNNKAGEIAANLRRPMGSQLFIVPPEETPANLLFDRFQKFVGH